MANKSPPLPQPAGEEPPFGNEPDIPSDGRDVEGEKMIREIKPTHLPVDEPEK